ncbi:hypothetical protein [Mesorhizobium sp. 8]|uniref:hypothetical protein n=1 Tax=Mesorhizobium sp. 8 TaxID=2584466 RepID=UPI0011227E5A|nr:hypothetical protein [Mesorhizobium sp. 8]QDC01732.1 hypothetical protein FGU64_15595 [Mesorhizobium sp. 8]
MFAALLMGFVGTAAAGEFGNVFGNEETQKASRDASATALAAVEKAVSGLRARELQDGSGVEQFMAASRLFAEAADKMEAVLKTFPNQELSEPQIVFLKAQFSPDSQTLAQLQGARSLQDVYRNFAAKTREMSGTMEGLATKENAFSVLSPLLVEYFQLADAIVAVRAVK